MKGDQLSDCHKQATVKMLDYTDDKIKSGTFHQMFLVLVDALFVTTVTLIVTCATVGRRGLSRR